MIKFFFILLCFSSLIAPAQTQQLKLTHAGKNRSVIIREGDKVLMAVKMARHEVLQKSSSVYILSKAELADSVFVFTKGRIKSINDSSLFIKERRSFFSADERLVRIEKINTLRKLSTGNQIFRTATTVGTGLAAAVAVFYSYVSIPGNCEGCIKGMFIAAGSSAVAGRFGRTKIGKKHLGEWAIEVVPAP